MKKVESRVNVAVNATLHRRLRIAAAKAGTTLQALVERILVEGLKKGGPR